MFCLFAGIESRPSIEVPYISHTGTWHTLRTVKQWIHQNWIIYSKSFSEIYNLEIIAFMAGFAQTEINASIPDEKWLCQEKKKSFTCCLLLTIFPSLMSLCACSFFLPTFFQTNFSSFGAPKFMWLGIFWFFCDFFLFDKTVSDKSWESIDSRFRTLNEKAETVTLVFFNATSHEAQ